MTHLSKGQAGHCAHCGKHFIAKRKGQQTCGNKTCSTMNSRKKSGKPLYPNFNDLNKPEAQNFRTSPMETPSPPKVDTSGFNYYHIEQPPPPPTHQSSVYETPPQASSFKRSMSEDVFNVVVDAGVPFYMGYVTLKPYTFSF